jgi:hypothetical protein
LVYDVDELREMRKEEDMPLWDSPEVLANTPLGRKIVECGAAKAREEARQEGFVQGMALGILESIEQTIRAAMEKERLAWTVSTIRKCLARRFPKLLDAPELGGITSSNRAGAILDALMDAQDEQTAIRALRGDSV